MASPRPILSRLNSAVRRVLSEANQQQIVRVDRETRGPVDERDTGRLLQTIEKNLSGADAVIGHHAHITRGIEFHHGKPIFHGLGNGCVVTRALSPDQDHPARRVWAERRKKMFVFEPEPAYVLAPFHPEAINAFLDDIYGERRILKEGVLPADLILGNPQFRPEIAGMRPPHGIWAHICGIDLVRTGPDQFFVLEDNARTPSGVSYMLENREAMVRLCPELFGQMRVAAVDSYPDRLLQTMKSVAPPGRVRPPTIREFPGSNHGHACRSAPHHRNQALKDR